MAGNIEQAPLFVARRREGLPVVRDPPKFDLESYISNYDGRTRLERLLLIGQTSTYLSVDAFRLAITEAKQGRNIHIYLKLAKDFHEVLPDDPLSTVDKGWYEQRTREVSHEGEKLEQELKAYKNNLIKESIRMGNEDLGHFWYACGDYSNAFKAYTRMREHCTSGNHIANMTLRLILVAIAQKSWIAAQSHIVKLEGQQLKPEEKAKLEPIISACQGLASMCTGQFRDAARSFLSTSPNFLTAEPAAGIKFQREVLTGNDVAVYGGLCALASMDRTELQEKVLNNSDFRNFLELEPHIRRAISLFCGSKYSACLEVLEAYRTDYMLDVYLAPLLREIYGRIRSKSIIQYFIPFSCVTLDEMAKKFQQTGEGQTIEDELTFMIQAGVLDARIDLVDRLLISPPNNPRYTAQADALKMAEDYDQTLRLRLLRLNMLNEKLEVRQPSSKGEERAGMGGGMMGGDGIGGSLRRLGAGMGFS